MKPFHLKMCCKALQSGKATDEVQNAEQSRSKACLGLSKLQPGSHNMHMWSAGGNMVLAAAAAGGSQTLGWQCTLQPGCRTFSPAAHAFLM